LTVPDTLLDDGLAAGDDAAVDAGADEDDDDEELHAAAVRPRHAMPSTAATRLVDDRNVSMMRH
jgi:hypothetical protein